MNVAAKVHVYTMCVRAHTHTCTNNIMRNSPMLFAKYAMPIEPSEPPMRAMTCRNCTCAISAIVVPPPPHPFTILYGVVKPAAVEEDSVPRLV